MQVALGIKARTGKAILVAIGSDGAAPQCLERVEFKLLPAGSFAPYHAAEGLPPQKARIVVEQAEAEARALAQSSIAKILRQLRSASHTVGHCGVLKGRGLPRWSTEDILAVHVRMHQAEGELFREVVAHGARACELALHTLPSDSLLDAAAHALGLSRAKLDALIGALGKQIGPPWAQHQKEAAAAALVALEGPEYDCLY